MADEEYCYDGSTSGCGTRSGCGRWCRRRRRIADGDTQITATAPCALNDLCDIRLSGATGSSPDGERFFSSLPPHADELAGLRSLVAAHLSGNGVDADESEVILISLEEACANAIVHGRPTEDIQVSVRVEGSTLALRVRDQGHGAVVEELLPITMPDPPPWAAAACR